MYNLKRLVVVSFRELLNQHPDNLKTLMMHAIYNELSNSRNPNNMSLLSTMFNHSPELSARVSATCPFCLSCSTILPLLHWYSWDELVGRLFNFILVVIVECWVEVCRKGIDQCRRNFGTWLARGGKKSGRSPVLLNRILFNNFQKS